MITLEELTKEWERTGTPTAVDLVTGWWGGRDYRPRCIRDGKVIKTEVGATETAYRSGLFAYQGKCGYWHLSSRGQYKERQLLRLTL